jgi:hypothetical protein
MNESIVETVVSPDGRCRVVVTRRSFGGYSAQRQWLDESGEWGSLSLPLGFYDSVETAAREVFAKPEWR